MTEAERIANDIVAAWKQEPANDRGLDPLREAIAAAITSAGEAIPVSPTPDQDAQALFTAGWEAAKRDSDAADDEDIADAPDVAFSDYVRRKL